MYESDGAEAIHSIPELRATRLYPALVAPRKCPKCAARAWRLPHFLVSLLKLSYTAFDVSYCQGALGTTKTVTVPSVFGMQKAELENTLCAGVQEEHLHVHCGRCCYRFIMHLPGDDEL